MSGAKPLPSWWAWRPPRRTTCWDNGGGGILSTPLRKHTPQWQWTSSIKSTQTPSFTPESQVLAALTQARPGPPAHTLAATSLGVRSGQAGPKKSQKEAHLTTTATWEEAQSEAEASAATGAREAAATRTKGGRGLSGYRGSRGATTRTKGGEVDTTEIKS